MDLHVSLIQMKLNFKTLPPFLLSVFPDIDKYMPVLSVNDKGGITHRVCAIEIAIFTHTWLHLYMSKCVDVDDKVYINVCDGFLFAKCVDVCNLCLSWLSPYTVSADGVWEQVFACLHAPPSCCTCTSLSWRVSLQWSTFCKRLKSRLWV